MKILDMCCGSKMFWYEKHEPHTTYMDIRKATRWHKQSDEDEAERERLIDLMNQIYVLTGHDPEEKADDLAEKLDQIRKLTKKA